MYISIKHNIVIIQFLDNIVYIYKNLHSNNEIYFHCYYGGTVHYETFFIIVWLLYRLY